MSVRREEIPLQFVDLTPTTRAQADQLHARAMEMVRHADWYVVTVAHTNEDGRCVKRSIAGGAGDRELFRETLSIAAIEAVRMLRELPSDEEEGA